MHHLHYFWIGMAAGGFVNQLDVTGRWRKAAWYVITTVVAMLVDWAATT